MKKTIIILLIMSQLQTFACDICGCANGSSFVGILPRSGTQFVGLRYRLREFDSHLNSQLLKTKEVYQTFELWGRFYPIKNLQIMGFVPYHQNHQTMLISQVTEQKKGLGDAMILGHYNVLNTFLDSTNQSGIYQTLVIGGGIKLPTGKFDYGYGEGVVNPNFQLGTGSTDFVLSAIHTIRRRTLGLNSELGSRITTKSNKNYQFGNRINGSITAFYANNWGLLSIMPNIGTSMDFAFRDIKEGQRNSQTGGFALTTNLGIEIYFRKFISGFSWQKPIIQNLSNGELKAQPQYSFHFAVGF